MMNKDLFTEGLDNVDLDAVERALRIEKELERKRARRRRAWIRPVLIAAVLALLAGAVALIVPYIPRTYDLDYSQPTVSQGNAFYVKDNVWIYYTTEEGEVKREYVHLPASEENVLLTWKHLNNIGEDVQITCTAQTEPSIDIYDTLVPQSLQQIFQSLLNKSKTTSMTVGLSAEITALPNYDALIESLTQTLAKYAGIDISQILVYIEGITTIDPPLLLSGPLQFWHTVTSTPLYTTAGRTLDITVGMTNVSLENIEYVGSWSAFVPGAVLCSENGLRLLPNDYPMTEEYQKYVLAPGESRSITYTFSIPEDAPSGAYSLVLGFEKQSVTFEDVVHLIRFGEITTVSLSSVYEAFLDGYGFKATDPAAFKSAVQALSYNDTGLFDIMIRADVDWAPGYSGDIYSSDYFEYTHTAYSPDGVITSHTNTFTAFVLPDGMTLPFAISPDEGLVEALCRCLGMSKEDAQHTLEERRTSYFTDGAHSSIFVVTLTFHPTYINLSYEYGQNNTIDIQFDASGENFKLLRIQTVHTPDAKDMKIVFTSFMYDDLVYALSAQQCERFFPMLQRAEMTPGEIEMECDSSGTLNGKHFDYDSTTGVLLLNGSTYTLTEQDRLALQSMINHIEFINFYFSPDSMVEVDSPLDNMRHFATLSDAHRDQIIAILNGGTWEWLSDGANVQPGDYSLTVSKADTPLDQRDIMQYHSESGTFVHNEYCLTISKADRIIVNEIFEGYSVQEPTID